MTPTLIVLALLALGVGIVAFATRRTPTRPYAQSKDQDTAWSDPVSADVAKPVDPFAHAPSPAATTNQDAQAAVEPAQPERQA